MTSPSAPSPTGDSAYIRGGGGVDVDPHRAVLLIAALCVLALLGTAVAATVSAANQNARIDRLKRSGQPVNVTVTGCLAVGSGVGMGVEYWQCKGDYTLNGQQYNEVIGGSRALLDQGQVVEAVAVPGEPAAVSMAAAVARQRSTWTHYVTAIVLVAAAAVLIFGVAVWSRSRRRAASARRP